MTRVLYVQGSAERAGAERMLLNLLRYLNRDAFAPAVAFLAVGPFIDEVTALGVPALRLPTAGRLREVWRWGAWIGDLRRAIRETGAGVVHANGEKMSVLAGRAARGEGVASIAWLHDAPRSGGPSGRMAQWALRRTSCDAVVACSRWMAEAFNRGSRPLGAVAIENGLDLENLPGPNPRVAEIRAEAGWPAGGLVVSHFARLQRWKGTDVFLRAAASLGAGFPEMRFLVVGDALYGRELAYARSLRRLASDLWLDGRLLFTGYRPDALEIMAGSDVVVHCSVSPDPFPTVVLEGMALGKPVVATLTGGPEEAMEDGRTGILVPPGDAGAAADAIALLARSPGLREGIGDAARRAAGERFSAARMASEFESLYLRLGRRRVAEEGKVDP